MKGTAEKSAAAADAEAAAFRSQGLYLVAAARYQTASQLWERVAKRVRGEPEEAQSWGKAAQAAREAATMLDRVADELDAERVRAEQRVRQ